MYKFYNANARGRFTNDCVIRAISLAEDKTWNETYDELSEIDKKKDYDAVELLLELMPVE